MRLGLSNRIKSTLSGGWLPTDEASLLAWYKLTPPSGTPTMTFIWEDSSGNDYHMKQATTANTPNKDATGIVTFDGVDDFLALDSGNITIVDGGAFLIAFRVNPTASNKIILGQVGSNTEMIKLLDNDTIRIKPGGSNADYDLSSGNTQDDAYWIVSREAGVADLTTVYKDGSQVDSTIAAPGEFNISQMGKRTTTGATENEFKGDIYEIMIFNETNADLIANVTARLASL